MSWLILGVCLLAGAFLGARWFMSADPKALAKIMRWGGIAVFALLIIYLTVTGRFLLVPPLVVLGLMIWRRVRGTGAGGWFPGLRRPPSPGQASDVETPYLRMSLDHDSGAISGEVRRGRFEGRELANLSFDELLELLAECRQHDAQSAQLIESYLDRVEGPEWRERPGADAHARGGGGDGDGRQQKGGARASGATMTRDEAYQVLGLEADASAADVKEAHRRLMLKIHPDQGGSNYLAAKINQAKEFLLGS